MNESDKRGVDTVVCDRASDGRFGVGIIGVLEEKGSLMDTTLFNLQVTGNSNEKYQITTEKLPKKFSVNGMKMIVNLLVRTYGVMDIRCILALLVIIGAINLRVGKMNEIWIKVILGMIPLDIIMGLILLGGSWWFTSKINGATKVIRIFRVIMTCVYIVFIVGMHFWGYNIAIYAEEHPTELCEVCNGTGRVPVKRSIEQ